MLEWLPTLPENSVDMVLCDPPYGVTACKWDSVIPLPEFWNALTWVTKPRGAMVVFATQPFASELIVSNHKMFRCEWIWDTVMVTNIMNAKLMPLRRHQNAIVFSKDTTNYYPQWRDGVSSPFGRLTTHVSNVWDAEVSNTYNVKGRPVSIIRFPAPNNLTEKHYGLHPTQKPVDLLEYLIKTYSQPDELVLDPTCGSGSTFVAARKCGRDYIGCDIEREWVDVALDRLERTDPFTDTPQENGEVQLSLFGSSED